MPRPSRHIHVMPCHVKYRKKGTYNFQNEVEPSDGMFLNVLDTLLERGQQNIVAYIMLLIRIFKIILKIIFKNNTFTCQNKRMNKRHSY